ncbi:MAG: hypothetical protein ACLU4J_16610 [Butyricimonas paravirosa]
MEQNFGDPVMQYKVLAYSPDSLAVVFDDWRALDEEALSSVPKKGADSD